ncbi:HNH endonuclease [Escherichia coli]|uniref:HNH endonuclease n=1 Tax=Escherichia coli TaxID=562 RepID=UPI00075176F4|nr:HNH endonuclease [Escherichia coli]KUS18349.1 hypothetical protein AWE62_04100 [Escherichia coli]HAH1116746.1 HNH endonuclease [Escherichia coli]
MRKLNENNVLVTLYKAKINNNADNTINYVDDVWISKQGEVYDSKKKKWIDLRTNNEYQSYKHAVHRMMGSTFHSKDFFNLTKKYKNVVINHIDEDKHNNEVSNIEWTAHSTNVKYSISKRKPMQDKFDVELIHEIYLHAYNVFGTNVLLDELTYSLNSTFNRSTSRKVYMELLRGKTYQEELQKVPTALVQKVQALFKK